MKFEIFYSWQSDSPNNTNRGFIQSVLDKAVAEIGRSDSFSIEPRIDHSTLGIPGAPEIADEILAKIKACDCFVADVTLITPRDSLRPSPNPNVLLELGYAIAAIGWDRIVLFSNEAENTRDHPFDIRNRRRFDYSLSHEEPKAKERKRLTAQFISQLIHIAENSGQRMIERRPILEPFWYLIAQNVLDTKSPLLKVDKLILPRATRTLPVLPSPDEEMSSLALIDPHGDPNWSATVDRYIEDFTKAFNDLQDLKSVSGVSIVCNYLLFTKASIAIDNVGSKPALDVRVTVEVPEWLEVMDELPDASLPKIPKRPRPERAHERALRKSIAPNLEGILGGAMAGFKGGGAYEALISPRAYNVVDTINFERGWGLSRDLGKPIEYWADKITHKRQEGGDACPLYLLPKVDAPLGEFELEVKVYHEDHPDYEMQTLLVEVVEATSDLA